MEKKSASDKLKEAREKSRANLAKKKEVEDKVPQKNIETIVTPFNDKIVETNVDLNDKQKADDFLIDCKNKIDVIDNDSSTCDNKSLDHKTSTDNNNNIYFNNKIINISINI